MSRYHRLNVKPLLFVEVVTATPPTPSLLTKMEISSCPSFIPLGKENASLSATGTSFLRSVFAWSIQIKYWQKNLPWKFPSTAQEQFVNCIIEDIPHFVGVDSLHAS